MRFAAERSAWETITTIFMRSMTHYPHFTGSRQRSSVRRNEAAAGGYAGTKLA